MLRIGLFATPGGSTYTIYEVDLKGYYRIDFVRNNGVFNIDVDNVVFSTVRKKTTYVYGDSTIYDDYLKAETTLTHAQYVTDKDSSWENGVFQTVIKQTNEKLGYSVNTVQHNGINYEVNMSGGGYVISKHIFDENYNLMLDPLNFRDYKKLTLSKDTVYADNNGVFYTLEVLKRRYDLSHIEENDFVVATDIESARMRLRMFVNDPFPLRGFDTETTGLDVCMYGEDHMVGIILGHNSTTSTYFPFRHEGDFNLPISFLDELVAALVQKQDICVAHNKKFDREVMLKEGYDIRVRWDTLHISIVDNPVLGKGVHGEKELMFQLDGKHYLELNEIFVTNDINFAVLTPELIKYYACPDGTGPIKLFMHFRQKMRKNMFKLCDLECRLADVKADQEYYGLRVDRKKFEHQYNNCNYIVDKLLEAFRIITASDGNINSADYLSDLMYNKMHCKVLLRTDTGKASTSVHAINKLAKIRAKTARKVSEDLVDLDGKVIVKAKDLACSAYPALVILSAYKKYMKLKTAFYARFERTMKTGRIFFWINQSGAATGRQSSPMHQLPPELKACILSDSDNRDFWGPDYSQVELRMIAYLAGEKKLIELASDPDNDIHRIIGSLIQKKDMWAITKEERSMGKRRNFGVVYTISKFGLAEQIFGPGYTKENADFCGKQIDEFFDEFKRIRRFIYNNGVFVQKHGYIETAWFHRRRPFPQILDPNTDSRTKSKILRMSNNLPVQGTAAELLKCGEVQMDDYIRAKGWNKIMDDGFPMVRNMLSIHDEIIISAHESIPYEEIIEMIKTCMEIEVKGAPPFFVQPARMSSWGDHESDQAAMPIRYRDEVIENYHKTGKSVFKCSYYKLAVPSDVASEVNTSNKPQGVLLETLYSRCKLEYINGDYEYMITDKDVKKAFKNYIESGFTKYRVDNYIELLNTFRHQQVDKYMAGLIAEYGNDYKVVGEHVRHPSLTHELLSMYEEHLKGMDLTHEEKITEAARLYMEDVPIAENVITINIPKETDKDRFTIQLEPLVQFDRDGNVVYEDVSEEEEPDYEASEEIDPEEAVSRVNHKPDYVFEIGDTISFDVDSLTPKQIDKVLSYIFVHKDDDGFYSTNLIYGNKLVPTKMSVENMDIEEANNLVNNLIEETL